MIKFPYNPAVIFLHMLMLRINICVNINPTNRFHTIERGKERYERTFMMFHQSQAKSVPRILARISFLSFNLYWIKFIENWTSLKIQQIQFRIRCLYSVFRYNIRFYFSFEIHFKPKKNRNTIYILLRSLLFRIFYWNR